VMSSFVDAVVKCNAPANRKSLNRMLNVIGFARQIAKRFAKSRAASRKSGIV